MFQRLITQDSQALYTIAAFAVATSIFTSFAWRALRMRRPQIDHLANLPFETPTPATAHERQSESATD